MDASFYSIPKEKKHFTYAYLHQCARFSIEQAETSEEGSFYNCMSAIVFLAFCIEAYFNQIGKRLFPFWAKSKKGEFEPRLSHQAKLQFIAHELGITEDLSHPPFRAYIEIFKFRELIAHAKPGDFSQVETMCTIGKAKRLLVDTESMIAKIHEKAGYGDRPFAILGITGWKKGRR